MLCWDAKPMYLFSIRNFAIGNHALLNIDLRFRTLLFFPPLRVPISCAHPRTLGSPNLRNFKKPREHTVARLERATLKQRTTARNHVDLKLGARGKLNPNQPSTW